MKLQTYMEGKGIYNPTLHRIVKSTVPTIRHRTSVSLYRAKITNYPYRLPRLPPLETELNKLRAKREQNYTKLEDGKMNNYVEAT